MANRVRVGEGEISSTNSISSTTSKRPTAAAERGGTSSGETNSEMVILIHFETLSF